MTQNQSAVIGYACAYTPLALIDAAGFAPYRILPLGDWPDHVVRYRDLQNGVCLEQPHCRIAPLAQPAPLLAGDSEIRMGGVVRQFVESRPPGHKVESSLDAVWMSVIASQRCGYFVGFEG